jgi:hypothetical protein
MSQPTLESLARQAAAGDQAAADAFCSHLLPILQSLDGATLERVARCALALKDHQANGAGGQLGAAPSPAATNTPPLRDFPPGEPLAPELLEWARRQFTEEELVSSLRELRANGGLGIEDLVRELEAGLE